MGVLADKLSKALDEKNNVNSYIWKGPKKNVNGQTVQEEVKLVDATPEQLNQFYKHCMSMLYSKDDKNPGRHHLFEIVDEQKRKCNTELFIRWLENRYQRNIPKERPEYKRFLFLQDMLNLVDQPAYKERYGEDLYKINIDSVVSGYPAEFRDITVGDVRDGCLDALGVFDRSHLSLNFITKLGVWFTPQEKKDLEEKDEKTGKNRDRLDVIKERHNLKQNVKLKVSQTGLSYSELRAMLNLKSKRYSELTTEQLITLRSKVLFRFQDEIRYHMRQWNERVKQIEEVADLRGIKLEKVEF